mmetsp:Transcript_70537/g.142032  ORF Transcript_70537/g.142032 Transcript_70537/m.142032 type:complete len:370 (+) Transcript_70537:18-1127(+)
MNPLLCVILGLFPSLSLGLNLNEKLEKALISSYQPTGIVREGTISVGKTSVHFLAAGPSPATARKLVILCHGAAFTSETWRIVGVIDELGEQGYSVAALDLPGFGKSGALPVARLATSDHREVTNNSFLVAFARSVGLREGSSVVVVAASMGGTFAAPFIADPGPYRASGYVAIAASLPRSLGAPSLAAQGGPAAASSVPHTVPPALVIFGSEDPRLRSDRARYEAAFPRSDVVVFDRGPHPAYLRDRAAARLFVDLVLQFVGGKPSSSSHKPVKAVRLEVGARVESRYFRGTSDHSGRKGNTGVLPGAIVKVHGDATYDLRFDDGDTEARVPASFLTSLEYAGQTPAGLASTSGRSEVQPVLKFKAAW